MIVNGWGMLQTPGSEFIALREESGCLATLLLMSRCKSLTAANCKADLQMISLTVIKIANRTHQNLVIVRESYLRPRESLSRSSEQAVASSKVWECCRTVYLFSTHPCDCRQNCQSGAPRLALVRKSCSPQRGSL